MPKFDLRGIRAAEYTATENVVSYSGKTPVGDAMSVDLELSFAEGKLYSEGSLSEYMKLVTGGTISMGVKYIKKPAQIMMFDSRETTRTINTKQVPSVSIGANCISKYVGVSFYAPDKIDGVTKYTAVHIKKALFGPPGMSLKTKGENIEFSTPTVTGNILADDTENKDIIEVAELDTVADANAWCDAVLGAMA